MHMGKLNGSLESRYRVGVIHVCITSTLYTDMALHQRRSLLGGNVVRCIYGSSNDRVEYTPPWGDEARKLCLPSSSM